MPPDLVNVSGDTVPATVTPVDTFTTATPSHPIEDDQSTAEINEETTEDQQQKDETCPPNTEQPPKITVIYFSIYFFIFYFISVFILIHFCILDFLLQIVEIYLIFPAEAKKM